jgi:hypothetical protein
METLIYFAAGLGVAHYIVALISWVMGWDTQNDNY